jgi:hypothetical protein
LQGHEVVFVGALSLGGGGGAFSVLGWEGGLVVKKALDKLCPIAFM